MLTLWTMHSRIGVGASIESIIGLIVHLVWYIKHPPEVVENLDESIKLPTKLMDRLPTPMTHSIHIELGKWYNTWWAWVRWTSLLGSKAKKLRFSYILSQFAANWRVETLFQTFLSDYRSPCGFFVYLATSLFQICLLLIIQLSDNIFLRILCIL